jgi:hypothetical protein
VSRLTDIKKRIKLTKQDGHIHVEMKVTNRRTVKQLSNVHADLTRFELDCVYVYMYTIMARHVGWEHEPKHYKKEIKNTNYATVFGSPWGLK